MQRVESWKCYGLIRLKKIVIRKRWEAGIRFFRDGGEVVVSEVKVLVGMKGVKMMGRLLKQKKP